jgi:hypothetical protein
MRVFSTLSLVALLAASVSQAAAAPAAHPATGPKAGPKGDATASDVRCLITMAAIGQQDKARQQASVIGAYFFAGRLSARAPGLNLATAIKAQEATMSPQELPAEAQRCGPLVQAAVQGLQKGFAPAAGAPAPAPSPAPAPALAPAAVPPAAPK